MMKSPDGYRRYLLALLIVILASNAVDRLMLGLLLQEIKLDLNLSDAQLGFLSGIAFALFYSIMGIPIARWADRGNRVLIIAVSTALWSAAVALCGVSVNFLQLLIIRVGVAVGEAGCIPPAHSLIADYFSRSERPRAIARYMFGGPLSAIVGYLLAGWLNQLYGWRVTFALLGLPGLVLGALAWLTLREPRREKLLSRDAPTETNIRARNTSIEISCSQPSLREVCGALSRNRTFRHLLVGYSILYFFGAGIVKWQPAFFIRSHGLETGELGTWFAAIWGGAGLVGTYLGGELASRYAANNERLQLIAIAFVYSTLSIINAGVYLSSDKHQALLLLGLGVLALTSASGPMFATIQTLVPERMRAVAVAAVFFFANLVGMGLGPLAAGWLSDVLRPSFGEESLRYALLSLCPGYLWCAWHLWRGATTVTRDLELAGLMLSHNQPKEIRETDSIAVASERGQINESSNQGYKAY